MNATAAPSTGSPAPAELQFGAELLISCGIRPIPVEFGGSRICECCGSSTYGKSGKFLGFQVGGVSYYYDGSGEDAARAYREAYCDNQKTLDDYYTRGYYHPADWRAYLPYCENNEVVAKERRDSWVRTNITIPYERRNRKQVIYDPRPLEEAKDWWFTDPELRKLADGIEINDPDLGVHSVLWVNA